MIRPEQPEYLAIGQVIGPRGVRGELRLAILTDAPERFHQLKRVFLGEEHKPHFVEGARLHVGQALLRLRGITDRSAAEIWRGAYVYVALADALPLEQDEYYYHQIVGLAVETAQGEPLGSVRGVLATGGNDVYVIASAQGELLLPAIKSVILEVDLEAGVMRVCVPEGLP